jgi:hypothetical protein
VSGAPNLFHAENGWRQHDGGECPIPRDATVNFQFACGQLSSEPRRAGNYIWKRRGWDFDIKAYKVVSKGNEQ